MNIQLNVKTISMIAAIVLVLVGTNTGQYFLIWKPKINELTASYEQRIAILQSTIQRIGPMVNVWTIKNEAADIFPGKQIEHDDLTLRELPESFVTPSLVLNPETVIGKYYRIGLLPGTTLSMDMVMEDPMDDTVREYDVVASVMPIGLKVGDYIDYRLVYPRGEDYIVLPHKRVEAIHDKTIKLKMSEIEIHYYQAALIDYFLQSKQGATLYLTKYLEPGVQEAATPYYAVPDNILAIMTANPNMTEIINTHLNGTTREMIDAGKANVTSEDGSAISSGRNEISGKIDAGKTDFENAEKERLEAEAKARLEESMATPSQPVYDTAGSAGTPPADSTMPGNPLLEIERGVVE